jgi:hypothetical protein
VTPEEAFSILEIYLNGDGEDGDGVETSWEDATEALDCLRKEFARLERIAGALAGQMALPGVQS